MIITRICRVLFSLSMILLLSISRASAESATDMLGAPGPITFQGIQFDLAWSANPSPGYFKQEYLPAGEQLEQFNQMFIVEALDAGSSVSPETAASAKINTLKKRSGSDPLVNYGVIRNDATGEIILDFVLSDSSTGTLIVEWNAYRYARLGNAGGVALYAISRRGYGDAARDFLIDLKQKRPPDIEALAKLKIPVLQPSR